jgi:microcystin degradation protein MlrC
MKIFLASISTETNTFAMAPTGLGAFDIERGESAPGPGVAGQLRQWADEGGHTLAWSLAAFAQPDGLTVRAVWEALRDEVLDALRLAMPVDAVILPLHGAMVAEGEDDCEGDLIQRVRAIVGPQVPIGVELDLHCHFTEKMRRHADIIIAYKEYPHTDVLDRLQELWRLTLAAAQGRIKPVTAVFDCRMVNFWHTTRQPMMGFVQRMKDLEGKDGVLSVSFGHGFPYGDVPESGAKVWVVTDNDLPKAEALAEQLGREIWDMREATRARQLSIAQALDHLQAAPAGKPLVLADMADNPGGGAMCDSSFILRALLERGIGNVALGPFWDLGALQICRDAGVGARLSLRVGGKCGPASGDPVDLKVTVRAVKAEHAQTVVDYPGFPCGPSVWVSTDDGIDLVLITKRQQGYATDLFTGLGVDLASKRAIVVKSTQHFHDQFAPIAQEVLYVDSPGLLRSDFEHIPYRRRSLNYWPRVQNPWEIA